MSSNDPLEVDIWKEKFRVFRDGNENWQLHPTLNLIYDSDYIEKNSSSLMFRVEKEYSFQLQTREKFVSKDVKYQSSFYEILL